MIKRITIDERAITFMGICFFAVYLIAQFFATVSNSETYPLQAYRMYSDHWKDGTGFIRMSYIAHEDKVFRPWELISVPFFQANSISYLFIDKKVSDAQKKEICQFVLSSNDFNNLEVLYQEYYYRRSSRSKVNVDVKNEKTVFRCNKGGEK